MNKLQYFLLITCLLTFSCKKTEFIQSNEESRISIDEARMHFAENFAKQNNFLQRMGITSNTDHVHNEECEHNSEKRPMWEDYKYRQLSGGSEAILIPLHKNGTSVQISAEYKVKYGFLNYMMMYKDSVGEIVTEWVQLKPSIEWFKATGNKVYDGQILVKNWDGTIKKIFDYKNGVELKKSAFNKKYKSSSTPTPGPTTPPDPVTECVTTTYYITVGGTKCSCAPHHSWGQACTCVAEGGTGPTKGDTYKIIEVSCFEEPPVEGEEPGGGTGGSGGGTNGPQPGGGGSTTQEDYPPMNCNPDPSYTVPTTPPPAGMEYILPCSSIPYPIQPIENQGPEPQLTNWQQLVAIFYSYGTLVQNIPLTEAQSAKLIDFIYQREDNAGRVEVAHWGTQEIIAGNMTWDQFEAWFLSDGPPETEYLGHNKGINNPTYWMNASFSQQQLPSYATFQSNFPIRDDNPIGEIAADLGGELGSFIQSQIAISNSFNTCAIRLSIALQKSGIQIPNIPDPNGGTRKITMTDANGNNYFLRADEMDIWMQLTFGTADGKARFMNLNLTQVLERNTHTNTRHRQYIKPQNLNGKVANQNTVTNFINQGLPLNGTIVKRGIYALVSESIIFATGHVDILNEDLTVDGNSLYLGAEALKILNIWHF